MKRIVKNILYVMLTKILSNWDYSLAPIKSIRSLYPDLEPEFWDLYEQSAPYSLTSVERMYALFSAVRYIVENKIPGDFCECGVWKGGSSMLIANALVYFKDSSRKIYLYDTFEGMSEPSVKDYDLNGIHASKLLVGDRENNKFWAYSPLDEVRENMTKTSYPKENIIYIKGKVEDTIPSTIPLKISLLRLDTDWYESTMHEMTYLYPILSKEGVLIIDDYGHFKGCKEAVDEYFQSSLMPFLCRIDYTGRILIKL